MHRIFAIFALGAAIVGTTGCVVAVREQRPPPPPYYCPYWTWIPGHYGPYGNWHPGHWRCG
ncbi:MAG: hypothetical protein JST54_23790 [Deltaproteobacteria bacterium]|nr:hypothetical protein [Deltaproteobacteria bacterium]